MVEVAEHGTRVRGLHRESMMRPGPPLELVLMTAAAYRRPHESGRRDQGPHLEENARHGAQDENQKVAKSSGGEVLRFRYHAFCIKYQGVPSEKSSRSFPEERGGPAAWSKGCSVGTPWPADQLRRSRHWAGDLEDRPGRRAGAGKQREEAFRVDFPCGVVRFTKVGQQKGAGRDYGPSDPIEPWRNAEGLRERKHCRLLRQHRRQQRSARHESREDVLG